MTTVIENHIDAIDIENRAVIRNQRKKMIPGDLDFKLEVDVDVKTKPFDKVIDSWKALHKVSGRDIELIQTDLFQRSPLTEVRDLTRLIP